MSAPGSVAVDVSAIPARPAGAGRYVIDLVAALAARGDVGLRLLTRRNDVERWPSGSELLSIAPNGRILRVFYGEVALGRAVRRHRGAEVLHGPHYTLPSGTGLPSVVTVHDVTLLEHPEWHEQSKVLFFRRALRAVARRADVVVVPSEFVANGYREHFGSSRPVIVIPHGVDQQRFAPGEPEPGADQAVLDRLGFEWPYVLNVATSEPRKNRTALVAAFGMLSGRHPETRLVLTGGGGWRNDELEASIASSPAKDRIVRTGYLADDDIPALLRRAAAAAYPSWSEGFGLPALEAMAAGAPLVTTAASAMAEVTGDTALLVEPWDASSLAVALDALLAGGPEVARRRSEAISRAAGYTWAASAASHVEAYALARDRAGR